MPNPRVDTARNSVASRRCYGPVKRYVILPAPSRDGGQTEAFEGHMSPSMQSLEALASIVRRYVLGRHGTQHVADKTAAEPYGLSITEASSPNILMTHSAKSERVDPGGVSAVELRNCIHLNKSFQACGPLLLNIARCC